MAPYAQFSADTRGRKHQEPSPEWRAEYQRDRDRVIRSRAFRRLEYKTQVFLNGSGDHFRTRLTHTMEVAAVSRNIARALKLNEDLAETIALAHDLGDSPFGHQGEAVLNRLMKVSGGFEHNRQSLRIVEELEQRYPRITEFYGEYGSGKSQICHQLCVNVQLPPERGGLNGAALYVDTENTFRLERIVQMSKFLGLDPEKVVKNIIYAEAYTSDHQMFLLENADEIIKANNVKLIIVDSLTAHFRSEYLGREMLASRQQKLNKHMHKLIALARAFNAVAVVTNQVMAKPDQFFGDAIHPIGGNIVGHTSHTRIYLRRAPHGPTRIARLVSSPYLPEGEEILKVTENGIEDISEEEKADKASKSRGR